MEIKGLSAEFLGHLDIAIVDESLDEIVEKYNVKTFPSLLYLTKNPTTGIFKEPYAYKGKWEYKQMMLTAMRYSAPKQNLKPEHSYFDKERSERIDEKMNTDSAKREEKKQEKESKASKAARLNELNGTNEDEVHEDTASEILLVHSSTQKSGPHREWEQIRRKLKGLVRLVEFNPNLDENRILFSNDFKATEGPFIAVFPNGKQTYRKKYMKIYNNSMPFSRIAEFINEYTPDPTQKLDMESMRYMITRAVTTHKGAVILYHNSPQTLLSYRGNFFQFQQNRYCKGIQVFRLFQLWKFPKPATRDLAAITHEEAAINRDIFLGVR